MDKYDWSSFTTRINIKAPREKLFYAWATQFGMELWFLRLSEYKKSNGEVRENDEMVQPGDTYKWMWHGYPDDVAETGEILDCNDQDFLKFSFGKAGNCTVSLKQEEGDTIVELVQEEYTGG